MPDNEEALKAQLAGLIDTLNLLVAQARAYERVMPSDNYMGRVVIATMAKLIQQAMNEARGLAEALEPLAPAPHPFSPREFEVLGLVAEGLTNKEIAYRLGLSQRTIQFHLNSIFNKTDTASRTEAATFALKQGWL